MSKNRNETWEQYRERILEETRQFIEWGLRHPEQTVEIPVRRARDGGFPTLVGQWFWGVVLNPRADRRTRRWRNLLSRRRRT